MFELKISKKNSDQIIGWQFESAEAAKEFIDKLQETADCPYAPIIERDVNGDVVSSAPNPDWDIVIVSVTDTEKPKQEAQAALRLILKDSKKLIEKANKADKLTELRTVTVELSEAVVALAKLMGAAEIMD